MVITYIDDALKISKVFGGWRKPSYFGRGTSLAAYLAGKGYNVAIKKEEKSV